MARAAVRAGAVRPVDQVPARLSPRMVLRQLRAAEGWLDRPTVGAAEIRSAAEMAAKAAANLELMVGRLAAEDAEGHRRHAVRQAKLTKDVRGYRRAPATMPGYHLGRPSPVKGRKFEPTPPNVNDVLPWRSTRGTAVPELTQSNSLNTYRKDPS